MGHFSHFIAPLQLGMVNPTSSISTLSVDEE
jgi:hypothetical protein